MLAAEDPMPVCVALDYAQEGFTLEDARNAVEAVAQARLDARPDDHAARRLLGEWLSACGDERGEGYVALGICRREPRGMFAGVAMCYLWYDLTQQRVDCELRHISYPEDAFHTASDLPFVWFKELQGAVEANVDFKEYPTRQAAEDAAAVAFLRLPESRRAALLKGEM